MNTLALFEQRLDRAGAIALLAIGLVAGAAFFLIG